MGNYKSLPQWGIELSSIPVTEDATSGIQNTLALGNQFTLPTTHQFYKITAIEWDNGATVDGTVYAGALLIDADPPVAANAMIIAQITPLAQSGTDVKQKADTIYSLILPAGTKVTGWIGSSSATGLFGYDTISSANTKKAITMTAFLPSSEVTALGTSTAQMYVKVYYKGIG